MRTLFLRLLPYLISIIVGMLLYALTIIYIKDANLNGLLVNVAAGLLGIPLVFISYELVKSASTSKLNGELIGHINLEIKHLLNELTANLSAIIPSNKTDDDFLEMPKHEIKKDLKTELADAKSMLEIKASFDKLLAGNKHIDLLPADQVRSVLSISKELRIFTSLLQANSKDSEKLATSVYAMMLSAKKLSDIIDDDEIISGSQANKT